LLPFGRATIIIARVYSAVSNRRKVHTGTPSKDKEAHMGRIWFVPLTLALVLALSADSLHSQEVRLRGFLNGSFILQDALFAPADGHRALIVLEELDDWFHMPDAGSTRIGIDVTGPTLFGDWRAAGTAEVDFHGAFAAAPPFGDEQPMLRLRLAYADLTNGRTTLRIGQQWSLTLGNIPVSTTHTGFVAGWGTGGVIGWRFPGISFTQVLTAPGAPTTASVQLAVLRGSWAKDVPVLPRPGPADFGIPQLEARLNISGQTATGTWGAYVVGHFDQKDFETAGVAPPPGVDNTLSSWAFQAGARLAIAPVTLHGNFYTGQAMGHHFGHFIQFGDISGWGGWGQVGVNLAPRWSIWTMVGFESADEDDVALAAPATARHQGLLIMPMLRFQAGPYSLGLELFHNRIDRVGIEDTLVGNQIAFSVMLSF
jgi:hypothetical protein